MSIKTLVTEKREFVVLSGDTIQVTYSRSGKEDILLTTEIKEKYHVTEIKIIEFKNEFGLERGLAVILGT